MRDATPAQILDLRVLDPSMGSGAFLVSACRYLADAYAEALVASGGCHATDLGPHERALIRRTIAERCLFGVDLNPMAVQLAQLSLWLATLSADRPLGFLDHHLVTGNSLVGAWLTSLRHSPASRQRRDVLPLFNDDPIQPMLKAALPVRFSLAYGPTDTAAQVRNKERALHALAAHDTPLSRWKRVADLWTARWLDRGLQQVSSLFPALADAALSGRSALPTRTTRPFLDQSEAIAYAHRAFHWELEFPEVFFTAAGDRRVDAGFDAVIGNPPWEMLRDDGTDGSQGVAARIVRFARDSGVYQAQSDGHANCYQLFLERSLALMAPAGRIGMVLPSGVGVDQGSARLRRWLFSSCSVETVAGFDNRRGIFDIHRSVRFVLLSAQAGGSTGAFRCRFGETDPGELEQACDDHGVVQPTWWPVRLSPTALERMSGPDLAVPDVRSPADVAIVDRISTRFPPLGSEHGWRAAFGRELNATEDRGAFAETGDCPIPVLEGKHVSPFVVRRRDARYSMSRSDARAKLGERYLRPRLAYRDVASSTNKQTLIAAILPAHTVSTHTLLCLRTPLPRVAQWYLCGLFNSFVLNYLVRLRVTTHVTTSIVERLPIPTQDHAGPAFGVIATLARLLSRGPRPEVTAALQARVARLYMMTGDEFAQILSTFPLVAAEDRRAALAAFNES